MDAIDDVLAETAPFYQQNGTEWNDALKAGIDPGSPHMIRTAVTMQQTLRAALPFLQPLSYEKIRSIFGTHLMVHVGGGTLMRYVLIRPGAFSMGTATRAERRTPRNDAPAHRVIITRPFYMAVHETTVAAYRQVGGNGEEAGDSGLPVTGVPWVGAAQFCRALSTRTGLHVRLPTEAQWEYACRAGSVGAGPTGRELDEVAWHLRNAEQTLHEVGAKKPNAWGLHDMLGNAWEWCRDWYKADYYSHSRGASDPKGPRNGRIRVVRGGGISSLPRLVTPAYREQGGPTEIDPAVGFRTVIELVP